MDNELVTHEHDRHGGDAGLKRFGRDLAARDGSGKDLEPHFAAGVERDLADLCQDSRIGAWVR